MSKYELLHVSSTEIYHGWMRRKRWILILLFLIVVVFVVQLIRSSQRTALNSFSPVHNFISSESLLTDNSTVQSCLIVHYFRLYPNETSGSQTPLSFIECMSVVSILKNLAPDVIYLHTNVPTFWPFKPCESIASNWTTVKLVDSPRQTTINGKNISFIQHEADIKKLETLIHYGGLVVDFDVYMINGTAFRDMIKRFPCVGCRENAPKLNAGFVYCQKGAYFPKMILEESYMKNYQPKKWVWNSGELPWILYQKNKTTLEIAEGVCNRPDPLYRKDFLGRRRSYEWRDKIAHHAFLHDGDMNYTAENIHKADSSMGDLLKWILSL